MVKWKSYLPKYLFLTIANLIAAINFNLLAKPINLVAGASPGLSLVISKIFNFSTSDIVSMIYVITFFLSIIFLGREVLIGIIYASIIYPIFIYLTENITDIIIFNYSDIFLITIIAGILSGVTNGIIYKNGFASSGLGVLAPIFNKYFKVSVSSANFVINAIIVLIGGYFFGFNIVLMAICYIYLSSYICNRIILGSSKNKVLMIHSKENKKIVDLLEEKYHLTATVFNNDLIMVVIKNMNYSSLKRDFEKIDNNVFFTASNCYEVIKK